MTLKTFYVIWRGDEDDFFVTRLDIDPSEPTPGNGLSNQQVVQLAWDAEYPNTDEHGPNPFVGDDCASYEMIDVFSGDNIAFHME